MASVQEPAPLLALIYITLALTYVTLVLTYVTLALIYIIRYIIIIRYRNRLWQSYILTKWGGDCTGWFSGAGWGR